jgi:ATP-dependent protease ClpP protease subunit
MTTKIDITGIIGIDTTYESIIQKLDKVKGDIEIVINSPGGFVYEGIAIHNAIKRYDRGKKTIIVSGLSASITSYIMLAGDKLMIEDNSVIMIHNPNILVIGDYRKLKTTYQHIEKLRNLMSSAYAKYTNLDRKEIETMMDNETYFVGKEELKTWGIVLEDKNTDSSKEPLSKEYAETQIKAMTSILEKNSLTRKQEIEQLVAILEGFDENNTNFTNFINNHKYKTMEKEKIETIQDFKSLYPKLYNDAINIGIQEERSRVKAHLEFIDVAKDTVINSIREDIPFLNNSEIQAKYLRARINKSEILAMEKENNEEFIPKKINENEELKKEKEAETEKTNKEAEEKIKSFMPHLNSSTNNNINNPKE